MDRSFSKVCADAARCFETAKKILDEDARRTEGYFRTRYVYAARGLNQAGVKYLKLAREIAAREANGSF